MASVSSTALAAFFSDHWLGQDGNGTGIRLYYGAPDNQIHELALFPNVGSQCFSQFVFSGTNGNAGFTSVFSDESGVGSLYLFDENNAFQVWSINFNDTHDTTRPACCGKWVEGESWPSPLGIRAQRVDRNQRGQLFRKG